MLIRLRGCTGWSAPLLFTFGIKQVFSWRGSITKRLSCRQSNRHGGQLMINGSFYTPCSGNWALLRQLIWCENWLTDLSVQSKRHNGEKNLGRTNIYAFWSHMKWTENNLCLSWMSDSPFRIRSILKRTLNLCFYGEIWKIISYYHQICTCHEKTCFCHMRTTSAQSDQHLCCSLPRQYNISSFYIQNVKPVASFCDRPGQFWVLPGRKPQRQVFSWRDSPNTLCIQVLCRVTVPQCQPSHQFNL